MPTRRPRLPQPLRGAALALTIGLSVTGTAAFGAGTSLVPDPTYTTLRGLRPEGPGLVVKDLVLERDVIRLRLDGNVHLLGACRGRTVAAVFVGRGSYELTPATRVERDHLALVSGRRNLVALGDRFDRAVLLFTDRTAEEIRASSRGVSPRESLGKAQRAYEAHLVRQRRDYRTNFQLRLLSDLLTDVSPDDGAFYAFVEGGALPGGLLVVDPRGVESSRLASSLAGETTAFYANHEEKGGFWYLSHRREDVERGLRTPFSPSVDALHYALDTRIRKDAGLEGTAVATVRVLREGLRVLPLALYSSLRIDSVSVRRGGGPPCEPAFVQEPPGGEGTDVAIVFPEPLSAGETLTLTISYKGTAALEDAGNGNYSVGARESWYPNLGGWDDPATFDLTFRVPRDRQVVSVGTLAGTWTEETESVSRWTTSRPVRVAGFNYGTFRKLSRTDDESGMTFSVFTNPGKPWITRELETPPSLVRFYTARLAGDTLVDALNTARTAQRFFGPIAATEVAITQQTEWSEGQSWPSLVFLPYLALLSSTTRLELGVLSSEFVEVVGPHELSHQWWGHEVGWASYHDQWLSEGFAEFSSALVLNQTAGAAKYLDFWKKARRSILRKPLGDPSSNDAGPISLGWRLGTKPTPNAYGTLVYSKGAYVVHMLRMAMADGTRKDPDARFREAMQDYVRTWSGRSPSTRDFQAVMERHLTPTLNLTGDGRLDWFFDQWVNGTEIPRFRHALSIRALGDGRYRMSGSISQSEVSASFRTSVPLYVELERSQMIRVGAVTLIGSTTAPIDVELTLPGKPRRVVPNAMLDVLARD